KAASGKSRGRQRHGNSGEQYRRQAGEVQIALGAAQGAADLTIAVFGSFDPLVRLDTCLDGLLISLQLRCRPAPELTVAHAASRLDYAGGLQVVEVHQYPWREAVEVTHAIRLVSQYAGQLQRFVADFDQVTDLQVQGGEQACLGPCFTRLRSRADLFWLIRCRGAA